MGGSRAWSPRANTDLPVPRRPAMITPPRPGSTADNRRASLAASWPVMAARGKACRATTPTPANGAGLVVLEAMERGLMTGIV